MLPFLDGEIAAWMKEFFFNMSSFIPMVFLCKFAQEIAS